MSKNSEAAEKAFNDFMSSLEGLDCKDNSCYFAKNKGGMRTNGGCRCLNGIRPFEVKRKILELWYSYKQSKKENGNDKKYL